MLLAVAERTLQTQKMRADIDSTSGEAEERRRHANGHKKETTAWEARKKSLAEAKVRCKSAAETKANKELVSRLSLEIWIIALRGISPDPAL